MKKKTPVQRVRKINPSTRVAVLFGIAFLFVLGFIGRLLYLQVFAGDAFRKEAYRQRRHTIEVRPARGIIYDRNKNPLAISVTVNTCYLFPKEVSDREKTVEALSYILGLEKEEIEQAMDSERDIVLLKSELTREEIDELKNEGIRSVSVEQEQKRFYPNHNVLSQVLGFTNDEGRGLYGLEAQYDDFLYGTGGLLTYSGDLTGNIIPTESRKNIEAQKGLNLYLTIDLNLQKILSRELEKAMIKHKPERISAILMDPASGEILAMENAPNFDPNKPYEPGDTKQKTAWNALSEDERLNRLYDVWKNPGVSSLYEPGSVFKSITTAISLETKSSKPSSTYLCTGSIEVAPGEHIYCVRSYDPHGVQTLEESLINSCNPAFVQIVREIGKPAFYSYLTSLRFSGKTGIDAPVEVAGLMPTSEEELSSVQMATMSYGHGISTTAVQMITAANATINGGYYYTPHFLREVADSNDQRIQSYDSGRSLQVFSKETSDIMRTYLGNVVQGDGSLVGSIDRVEIGGKSGTTELFEDGKYKKDATIASYWSFFPKENPRYSLLVVVKKPKSSVYGTTVSGEISAHIIEKILDSDTGPEKSSNISVHTPNIVGMTVMEAEKMLAAAGLKISVYGDMDIYEIIGSQSPKAEEMTGVNEVVEVLPKAEREVVIPDFIGKSREEVEAMLVKSGMKVEYTGEGNVVYQKPARGEKANRSVTVELTLQKGRNR